MSSLSVVVYDSCEQRRSCRPVNVLHFMADSPTFLPFSRLSESALLDHSVQRRWQTQSRSSHRPLDPGAAPDSRRRKSRPAINATHRLLRNSPSVLDTGPYAPPTTPNHRSCVSRPSYAMRSADWSFSRPGTSSSTTPTSRTLPASYAPAGAFATSSSTSSSRKTLSRYSPPPTAASTRTRTSIH